MKGIPIVVLSLVGAVLLLAPAGEMESVAVGEPGGHVGLMEEAERLYGERSYARAHEVYGRIDPGGLSPEDARWVAFRLADTQWRSEAATKSADSTRLDEARQQLEALIRDIRRVEDRDRVWAEVEESLADFWWARRDARQWGAAWPHYQNALDYWAGAEEIDRARERYLRMVRKMAKPRTAQPHYYYGYYGNTVPLGILDNVLKIARTESDRAHAHYLIAMTLRQSGDAVGSRRVPDEFEAAIAPGKTTDWHDDALYHYAEWLASRGRAVPMEGGGWHQEPDYVGAVALFRQLVREYQKGETRYYDQAKAQIQSIVSPVIGMGVANFFLPDSEVEYHLRWRNVARVDLSLYAVDLTRDVSFFGEDTGNGSWLQKIPLGMAERHKSWSFETGDKGEHRPGMETLRLEPSLPPGAYVLVAQAEGETARELILVTDASIVLKTAGGRALLYVCNVIDGSPLAGADIALWERAHDGRGMVWRKHALRTDDEGLAIQHLEKEQHGYSRELFVAASIRDRQALSMGRSYSYGRNEQAWRVYAFTDRPAYRPGDTARWKLIARRYDGGVYSTPSNERLEYEIYDGRGTKVDEGTASLNQFGSAWASLELTEAMPLGEFRVQFWTEGKKHGIGGSALFRLEEYKLPEFRVSVQTPEEDGKRRTFRAGETVEVSVEAEYYFGGPVANASVEVHLFQSPFHQWWSPPRPYPWFYEDMVPQRPSYWGGGQLLKRETLKTDAAGRAILRFDTAAHAGQDFEYRIEARVTDASRREVIGSDTVRVTRQRYSVYPRARHNIHRPQEKVTIDFKALDANDQPVEVSGTVKITRDRWHEIWLDPDGEEIRGEKLDRLRETLSIFPPPPTRPGRPGWTLKYRGYEHDEVATRIVKTDAEGNAELTFTPENEGYYRFAWHSEDPGGPPITAETTVWVATRTTNEVGYRQGGVEIIVDKDTFQAGQRAPIMLSVPTNDRYVLFTVEGENLYSHRLIHVTGTVKLIELEIDEEHVPNIFLTATMVTDLQMFLDVEQVVVPPVRRFLDVELAYDREVYQPREEAMVTVTTRDHQGRPVSAEVGLGLVDESVYYIQEDYAGDPRQFYYGQKRPQIVQTSSTFHVKSFRKLVVGFENELVDDESMMQDKDGRRRDHAVVGRSYQDAMSLAEGFADMERMEAKQMAAPSASKRAIAGNLVAEEAPASGVGGAPGAGPAVQVRSDFRATMFWGPEVVTGPDGTATVNVKFPDSLTGWRATARAATAGNEFGIQTAKARTRKPLIVRLQAPRFFVVGDQVTVSAIFNNNTDEPMTVMSNLGSEGVVVGGFVVDGEPVKGEQAPVTIPAGGEAREDWFVTVPSAGLAKLTVTARSREHSDAMEKTYVVHEHGIEKLIARSGKLRGDEVIVTLDLPAERRAGSTQLTVQVAPSMAVTMLDALPYLIDYPYGCTEQTMSRFLPAVITAKTLEELGIDPALVMGKAFGGIVREHAEQTHPDGKKSLEKLDAMVRQGLQRLYDFQHGDGGWGWWKGGESDHFMTAYVVWGLTLARAADVPVRKNVLERGASYLEKEIVEEEQHPDMQAWMLHALTAHHASVRRGTPRPFVAKAFENLWTDRDQLNAYTRALLALSAHHLGDAERARTLVRNLENGVKIDRTPDTSIVQRGAQRSADSVLGTAHWGEDGVYWRWSDGGVEATAFVLRALLAIDPGNDLIEPVSNWLQKNRRGAQWSNTRDTAIAVLAFNDYLRVSGELAADLEYELLVNGQSIVRKRVTGPDALAAPSRFAIDPDLVRDGANEIRIVRRDGEGPLYFAAEATFFSLEEPITPAGNEIFVRRQYYKRVGRPTLLKGYVYENEPLEDGGSVTSGERVEVVITIEAKNNYEYLVFEDLKPAGLEAVQIRSGESVYARELKSGAADARFATAKRRPGAGAPSGVEGSDHTGRTRWVYQELRDRKVALFVDKLPQGVWEIRYELRAEVPGSFHGLPVMGHAMYVPEIRANGQEVRITVVDRD